MATWHELLNPVRFGVLAKEGTDHDTIKSTLERYPDLHVDIFKETLYGVDRKSIVGSTTQQMYETVFQSKINYVPRIALDSCGNDRTVYVWEERESGTIPKELEHLVERIDLLDYHGTLR